LLPALTGIGAAIEIARPPGTALPLLLPLLCLLLASAAVAPLRGLPTIA
jgi:hypothetical protein